LTNVYTYENTPKSGGWFAGERLIVNDKKKTLNVTKPEVFKERWYTDQSSFITLQSVWATPEQIQITIGDTAKEKDWLNITKPEFFEEQWYTEPSSFIRIPTEFVLAMLVQLHIKIVHPREITDYLLIHPDMINKLLPICQRAYSYFGTRADLSLELYHDYDTESYLALYVRQSVYDENIIEQIDTVYEMTQAIINDGKSWFHITTDFDPPR